MISFFFSLVHDKHLQTSPELTTMTASSEGAKKKKKNETAEIFPFLFTSLTPSLSPYPSLLLLLLLHSPMCCVVFRGGEEDKEGRGGGTDPAAHLRFIWPPPGECGEALYLKEIASAFWSAWHPLKHTLTQTHTHVNVHTHAPQLA